MTRIIRVGIVQQACSNDIKANLEKLHGNIASVAQAGANLGRIARITQYSLLLPDRRYKFV